MRIQVISVDHRGRLFVTPRYHDTTANAAAMPAVDSCRDQGQR